MTREIGMTLETVKCVTGETLADYLSVSLRKFKNFEAAKEMLLAENRTAYVLYVNGEPIGVFDLAGEKTDETLSLCGVAVKASERGRGYGKLLVRAALTEAMCNKLNLNTPAFSLTHESAGVIFYRQPCTDISSSTSIPKTRPP